MSLQYQLSDARADSGIIAVSGECNNSNRFRDQINKVTRVLMKRGGWFGTEVLACFCIHSCKITLPRHVGTIIGMRSCDDQVDIKNRWYQIVGMRQCYTQFQSTLTAVETSQAPTYREIPGTAGMHICYHVVKREDVGKTITIYGTAFGGQPLQEQNPDGTWRMGVTLVAVPAGIELDGENKLDIANSDMPATSLDFVTKITHIVRQPTNGMSYLYALGPDANGNQALFDLAVYEPNETNPMYRQMLINNINFMPAVTDSYGRLARKLECMVKLEYIPLVNDNDFLLIDDFDALAYGIQALKRDENGEFQEAEAFWSKAIRELNFNDRNKSPGQQIAVKVRVTGSNRIITNPI